MKRVLILSLLLFTPLSGCLSKEPALVFHEYRPELTKVSGQESPGTRPLFFKGVSHPPELGHAMVWRITDTELATDELSRWARRPSELIEERLKDLLFGVGDFRESASAGSPVLQVQLVVFEGDTSGPESLASIELIVELNDGNDLHHRTRLRAEEPLAGDGPADLARGMGLAISSLTDRCAVWLRSRLSAR